jgi:hypothetical protein
MPHPAVVSSRQPSKTVVAFTARAGQKAGTGLVAEHRRRRTTGDICGPSCALCAPNGGGCAGIVPGHKDPTVGLCGHCEASARHGRSVTHLGARRRPARARPLPETDLTRVGSTIDPGDQHVDARRETDPRRTIEPNGDRVVVDPMIGTRVRRGPPEDPKVDVAGVALVVLPDRIGVPSEPIARSGAALRAEVLEVAFQFPVVHMLKPIARRGL